MYQTSIRNKKKHQNFNHNKEINYILNKEEEEYAYVINMLGNCRVTLITDSGIKCIGIISGSLRKFNKRILIEKGDIVVVTKSNPNDKKVFILHKFNNEQTNNLISECKISNVLINYYNNINLNVNSNNNEEVLENLDFSN
jgi:initiation factor 1A